MPGSSLRIALLLSVVAAVLSLASIPHTGMTIDEPLDVAPGRKYVQTLWSQGPDFFSRDVVLHVYSDNAEHPPLGRWLLGIASVVGQPIEMILMGPDPVGLYIRAARAAPALAFSALVGLVSLSAGRRYGAIAGLSAGLSLLLMPRVFAHGHLAALDTFVALFWTLALLAVGHAVESPRPVRAMALAGLVWGLAILTKIHGWLLPPLVLIWVFARLPVRRALLAFVVWGVTGLLTFLAGWPWLWYDSLDRLVRYARTGVQRTPIQVQYLGSVFRDTDVPWHYPWLYVLATVPLGLLLLAATGIFTGWKQRKVQVCPALILGAILEFLILFSTRVAVYDGERLFLPVFPLVAILAGMGFQALWTRAEARTAMRVALVVLLMGQCVGVVSTFPFGLSYYNLLVGGLPGAERLGLELTYWGDAVDPILLDELAQRADIGDTSALAPTLAPSQGFVATSRALVSREMALADQEAVDASEWVVIYRRPAYWSSDVRSLVENQPPVTVRTRQGVWLSGLWHHSVKKK
ncbi:MAG TPA: glycosyltransferase family 39 protein [Isosphaeraceae bacterium]|nr:glycosyltransferase family 39 protein [Isosphaeraceae bacterium]